MTGIRMVSVLITGPLSWTDTNGVYLLSTSVIFQLEARAGSEWMNKSDNIAGTFLVVIVVDDDLLDFFGRFTGRLSLSLWYTGRATEFPRQQ